MTKPRWHIVEENGALTLSRQVPARFDVSVMATLPSGSARGYANQIRQDMWRALQNVRGFSPVVRLAPNDAGWDVTAGGRVMGPVTASLVQQITDVLADPTRRKRWIAHANRKSGANL